MIRPGRYDITIPQRATFRERMRLKADGQPLNATGYELVAQVWNRQRTIKLADGVIEWVDRSTGLFDLLIQWPATTAITQDGQWDLLVIEPGGDRYYWLEGTAFLDRNFSAPVPPVTP
jgi:hypothetical protein